ncbi:hypothetical protein SAMN05660657_04477 [Geodermatophilus amargosae]|uniref:Phage integrase family protein n=1 Tax=Geodermatophilus amargosae TaxID=1296565 RepID=A0A1I7CHN7_9ACTN|nr:hypothetical protein SAMN05660657_04477 [Geodermatophilus amargosae]
MLPRWGDVPLVRIAHSDVQAWPAELSDRGLAGASVRKTQGVLSGVLGLAVRDRRLVLDPALGVALPALEQGCRRYLTAGRLGALAEAAGPGRVAVLVLGYCGLRRSELAALRVRHVDLLRRRVLIEEAVTEVDGKHLVWGTPENNSRRTVRSPAPWSTPSSATATPGPRGSARRPGRSGSRC